MWIWDIQSFLTDKEPKMVSDQGLMWLAKDVRWLVDHIKSLQNENLLDVFSELYQVKAFPPSLLLLRFPLITPLTLTFVWIDIESTHFSSNPNFLPRSWDPTNSILENQSENAPNGIDQIDDLVQYEPRFENGRWEEEGNDRGIVERSFGSIT